MSKANKQSGGPLTAQVERLSDAILAARADRRQLLTEIHENAEKRREEVEGMLAGFRESRPVAAVRAARPAPAKRGKR